MYSKHNMFTTCNMINGMNKIAINAACAEGGLSLGRDNVPVFRSSALLFQAAHTGVVDMGRDLLDLDCWSWLSK